MFKTPTEIAELARVRDNTKREGILKELMLFIDMRLESVPYPVIWPINVDLPSRLMDGLDEARFNQMVSKLKSSGWYVEVIKKARNTALIIQPS